jgi:VanZ family protein
MTRGRAFWILAAVWAVTIFGLSSIPGRSLPDVAALKYDKVIHATVYAILGGLFFAALRRSSSLSTARVVAVAALCALAYGLTDEFHQIFVPGRSAELYDALADGIGGSLGATLAALVTSRSV